MKVIVKATILVLMLATAAFAQYREGKPDLMLKFPPDTLFLGDNIFNKNAVGQTLVDTVKPGETAIFQVRVQNDVESAQGMSDNITVKGTKEDSGWTVRYFTNLTGGTDITVNVIGTGWSTGKLDRGDYKQMRAEVTPPADAQPGNQFVVTLTGTSENDPNKQDVIKAITTVLGTTGEKESASSNGYFLKVSSELLQISFGLARNEEARLEIYDIVGRPVAVLRRGMTQAGSYSFEWDGKDDGNEAVPSGVYFVRLKTDSYSATARLVLVR